MNKYSAVQWSPGGTTVNKGPTCTDRGPSVQVQFPHLKISTLTTGCGWCIVTSNVVYLFPVTGTRSAVICSWQSVVRRWFTTQGENFTTQLTNPNPNISTNSPPHILHRAVVAADLQTAKWQVITVFPLTYLQLSRYCLASSSVQCHHRLHDHQ